MFKFLVDSIDSDTGPKPNLNGAQVIPPNLKGEIIPSYYALKHSNWFYPICINTLYLCSFFHTETYLKRLLPKNVVKGLEEGRGYILIHISEPLTTEMINYLEFTLQKSPIFRKVRFLLINHSSNKNFIHCSDHETHAKAILWELCESRDDDFGSVGASEIESISDMPDRKFSCLLYTFAKNPDRYEILSLLENLNLLDDGFISADNKAQNFDKLYTDLNWISSLNLAKPPKFNSCDKIFANLSLSEVMRKVELNLVVEGQVDSSNDVFLSEKTFRNFIFKKPFILLGQCGSLKMLKELGYKTFSDIIDESYDDIEDNKLRIYTALRELKKFIKNTPDISSINEILEHNKQHQSTKVDRINKQLSALFEVR